MPHFKRVALVSARAAQALDEDLPPLPPALRGAGFDVEIVNWDDESVAWESFDAAILRSTWDYSMRIAEFFAWCERVSKLTTLLNPLPVVRWNLDKHYLQELAAKGVPIVPSAFVEPGEEAAAAAKRLLGQFRTAELVVKPSIGSGSLHAQRHLRERVADISAHIARLHAIDRSVLVQPYLERVDRQGETALMFMAGKFSHAIRKGPLLRAGEGPTSGLFATETIEPRTPTAAELRVGEQALAAIPHGTLLYARVDLIRDAEDRPCVLELELTEPSLFFAHGPGSPARFAQTLLAWR